jgi:replicative DNA helicase
VNAHAYGQEDNSDFRALPHSIEAEQALLGAILINNDAFFAVSDFLRSEHFYEALHQRIFEICAHLIPQGRKVNPITAKDHLDANAMVGEITQAQYLIRLAAEAATIVNARDFGLSIKDMATRRKLIAIGEELVDRALNADFIDKPIPDHADAVIGQIQDAVHGDEAFGLKSIHTLAGSALTQISDAMEGKSIIGWSTGLKGLDGMIDLMAPGEMIPLYGRSGGAKTALATQLGMAVARQGGRVLQIQMEMKGENVAMRVLSTGTGVSVQRQRSARINMSDYERLHEQASALKDLPFYLINPGRCTTTKLVSLIQAAKRRLGGLDMIIIDHQRLVRSEGRMTDIQTVENFFQEMVELKHEMNAVIMPLVQLKTDDPRLMPEKPKVSSAWGGDAINQSADMILATHNEYRVLKNNPPQAEKGSHKHAEWLARCGPAEGKIEIGVLKNRSGTEGDYRPFGFDGARMLFSDLEDSRADGNPMGLF